MVGLQLDGSIKPSAWARLSVEYQSGSAPFGGNIAKDHIVDVLMQTDWNVAKAPVNLVSPATRSTKK